MPMATESARVGNPLTISRRPVGPKTGGDKGSVGYQALMDSVCVVAGCWILLGLLMFSLRRHTV